MAHFIAIMFLESSCELDKDSGVRFENDVWTRGAVLESLNVEMAQKRDQSQLLLHDGELRE